MTSKRVTKTYQVCQIPDPSDTRFLGVAEGDVHGKIQSGFDQLWHTLAHMQSDSAEVKIIYSHMPTAKKGHKQNRLSIFLEITSFDRTVLGSLDSLIAGGTLSRFYEFKPTTGKQYDESEFPSACYIKRRSNLIEPLYTNEFNPSIPKKYFTISPFEACNDNNYLLLDQNLDKIKESVLIILKVCPADISKHLRAHTEYMAQIYSVNRMRRQDIDDMDCDQVRCDSDTDVSMLEPLNFRDPLADDTGRIQRKFHETLMEPHLKFEFKVCSTTAATGQVIASTICNSAFSDGKYKIDGDDEAKRHAPENFGVLIDLEQYATVEELAGIMKLPVGSYNSPLCIRKNNDPQPLEGDRVIVLGHDIQGFTYDDAIVRNIGVDLLCKHTAVFGMSGGGKSTFMVNLLIQLWALGIPCLVIETAKKEYRTLKTLQDHSDSRVRKLARDLRVYTPGYDDISPFRYNPLNYSDGTYELAHIESVKSFIESSIPVSCGSIPMLLFEALENIYELYRNNKDVPFPVMADLVSEIEHVFETKNYVSDVKANMQTVIETRLSMLAKSMIGKVFQCNKGVGIGELLEKPTVIELDPFQTEHKCISTLSLLSGIKEYYSAAHESRSHGLQNVIIIEESHNLLGSSAQSVVSEDMTDPQIAVAEYFSNLLLEFRSLGCGIVICDQHPSNIHESASKSVATKITFRETHSDDRDELEKSMLLGPVEAQDIARLKPGQGFIFTEGYYGPRKIQTENLHQWLNLKGKLTDTQLRAILEQEDWFKAEQADRISAELIQLSYAVENYENDRKQAEKRFTRITRAFVAALEQKDSALRRDRLRVIYSEFKRLRSDIAKKHSHFKKGPWKTYCYLEKEYADHPPEIVRLGSVAFNLYRNRSEAYTRTLVERIGKNIKKLSHIYTKGF